MSRREGRGGEWGGVRRGLYNYVIVLLLPLLSLLLRRFFFPRLSAKCCLLKQTDMWADFWIILSCNIFLKNQRRFLFCLQAAVNCVWCGRFRSCQMLKGVSKAGRGGLVGWFFPLQLHPSWDCNAVSCSQHQQHHEGSCICVGVSRVCPPVLKRNRISGQKLAYIMQKQVKKYAIFLIRIVSKNRMIRNRFFFRQLVMP